MIKHNYKKIIFIFFSIIIILLFVCFTLNEISTKIASEIYKEKLLKDGDPHHRKLPNFKYTHTVKEGKLIIDILHESFKNGKSIDYFYLSDTTYKPTPVWGVKILEYSYIKQIVYGEVDPKVYGKYEILLPAKPLIPSHKYSLLVLDYDRRRVSPEVYDFVYEP